MKKYYKFNFNMTILNILSILLFILAIIPVFIVFKEFEVTFLIIVYTFIWLILHEIIHGIGFMINKGVKFKNITFGALLEKGILYCMCKQRINKKAILISLISPFMVIGVITMIISFLIHDSVLAFLSAMNIGGAIGDLVMFIMIIRMPNNIEYTDLNDPTSFILISETDLSKFLIPGITISEVGDYDEKTMVPTDFRKVVISKVSAFIFILLILFVVFRIMGLL